MSCEHLSGLAGRLADAGTWKTQNYSGILLLRLIPLLLLLLPLTESSNSLMQRDTPLDTGTSGKPVYRLVKSIRSRLCSFIDGCVSVRVLSDHYEYSI